LVYEKILQFVSCPVQQRPFLTAIVFAGMYTRYCNQLPNRCHYKFQYQFVRLLRRFYPDNPYWRKSGWVFKILGEWRRHNKNPALANFIAPAVNGLINVRFDLSGTNANITSLVISARTTTGDIVLCSGGTFHAGANCFSFPTPVDLAGQPFRFLFTFTVQGGSPANRFIEFDDFGTNVAQSLTPLPVKFARLRATIKGQNIEVCFSNLTEKNVVTYSVQRSANGQVFTELAAISPLKNNDGEASYCYLDVTPAEGTNIYRVRSTETTGQVSYSRVLKVDGTSKGIAMVIAPNPATGTALGLQISNLPAGSYQFKIFSATGLLVGQEMLRHNGGSISQNLTLNNLKPGLYNLDLSGSYRLQKQFIVR
jgi:hypothetical protein